MWRRAIRVQGVSSRLDKASTNRENAILGNSRSSECLLSVSSIKEILLLQFILKKKENNSNLYVLSSVAPGLFARTASRSFHAVLTSPNVLISIPSTTDGFVANPSSTCESHSWINKWWRNRFNGWFRYYMRQYFVCIVLDRRRGERSTYSRNAPSRRARGRGR